VPSVRADLISSHQPANAAELLFVDTLARSAWRMHEAHSVHRYLFAGGTENIGRREGVENPIPEDYEAAAAAALSRREYREAVKLSLALVRDAERSYNAAVRNRRPQAPHPRTPHRRHPLSPNHGAGMPI